ncbi:uncharacterized protein YndB with AHSA1/START domain [Chitinophaga skermanii]|uniref:Uncharacterized protein YndB with AHSA1/START domain n=1 Tax=Chitinophaga skermanii TaxID=331697 RepID=A0A327Q723_9BACT|nr:SRPBCC domain-containing protein [Chitinophaga skermanii]RAJ00386.1 uncharacterized protein YndB with AHSA1/START domain [Chitinophaga skermanii]
MKTQDFTISFLVPQSAGEVFNAVNNVRGWWSEQVEGKTGALGEVFNYHYQDVHRSRMKIIEFIPNEKVVWLVEANYFNFTRDHAEWTNTKISFEIASKGDQTELVFTHIGLVPTEECYDICTDAWTNYIRGSLKNLITTGKGKPNPYQASIDSAEKMKRDSQSSQDYSISFLVDRAPASVYQAITEVDQWWSTHVKGTSKDVGDEFSVGFGNDHFSTRTVSAAVPFKRIEWRITDCHLPFLKDQEEWIGTENIFDIHPENGKTRLTFTHIGLQPAMECYDVCTKGWNQFIEGSLLPYILEGTGKPLE